MNKYLVALCVGGVMECPGFSYENFQVIEAKNQRAAEKEYDKINNCEYFYGSCLALKEKDGEIKILNKKVTYEQVEMLNK
jgi:hypothetical protein